MKTKQLFPFAASVAVLLANVFPAGAQLLPPKEFNTIYNYQVENRIAPPVRTDLNLEYKSLYRAPVDGCYFGVGDSRNSYNAAGIDCNACRQKGGKLKRNGSYVWGLCHSNHKIYWGTLNNMLCQFFDHEGLNESFQGFGAYETSCWVCDGIPTGTGNMQPAPVIPPRIYVYDPQNGSVKDITPADKTVGQSCTGIRSAGALDGVVFLAGPDKEFGTTIFAYSDKDDSFLGSGHFEDIITGRNDLLVTNIRKWIIIDDILYCGVNYHKGEKHGGAILRWTGTPEDPFHFEIAGYTGSEAAELEYHDGRIYVGSWPDGTGPARLFRSPKIPQGGFTAASATEWETVWSYDSYEVDLFSKNSCAIGAIKSYKGRLYWGILNISFAYPLLVKMAYKLETDNEMLMGAVGSLRSGALFSATDFSTPEDVELLYGEEQLPVFNLQTRKWELKPNASGLKPKWGRSGLGNLYTNYIWTMEIYDDKLYVGTMDMSNMIKPFLTSGVIPEKYASKIQAHMPKFRLDPKKYGFECMVIEDYAKEPYLVTDNGLGNPAAYGIRNMVVMDDILYVGTASPLNLHEEAGWQLYSFTDPNASVPNQFVPQEADVIYRLSEESLEFTSLKQEIINSVQLVDMGGHIVRSVQPESVTATVETSGCSAGVYLVQLRIGDTEKVIKVVIR